MSLTVLALRICRLPQRRQQAARPGQPQAVVGRLAGAAGGRGADQLTSPTASTRGTWISHDLAELLRPLPGPGLAREARRPDASGSASSTIPDAELWRTHERRRERLVAFARSRLREQLPTARRRLGRAGRGRRGAGPRGPDHRLRPAIRHLQAGQPAPARTSSGWPSC